MRRQSIAKTRTKQMACRRCETLVTVGSNTRNAPLCQSCAELAVRENAEQMVSRSGPNYEKWRAGMLRSLGE